MIHISILSYSLNSVQKRPKQFLEKVFVKITHLDTYVCRLSKILSVWIFWHVLTWIYWHVTQFSPKASEMISQRRFLPKLFICKRKIRHKGRKRFFPTVSIRSESVQNDFSEKVFVKIKMIHISILSYSLNSVQKRPKRFLEKVFVAKNSFRVCPLSVSIDYTLLLGARRSCGQLVWCKHGWAILWHL